MPTALWVAHVLVNDTEAYGRYARLATEAIAAHGGVFLARGGRHVQLEGADRPRNVVARFPSVEAAVACYHSPEYARAKSLRQDVADADLVIIEGYDAKPRCINTVGLKRHDYHEDDIAVLTQAFRLLYRQRIGIEPSRAEMFKTGPIRPVLRHLFDSLETTCGGRAGRGRDRRKKAA